MKERLNAANLTSVDNGSLLTLGFGPVGSVSEVLTRRTYLPVHMSDFSEPNI